MNEKTKIMGLLVEKYFKAVFKKMMW